MWLERHGSVKPVISAANMELSSPKIPKTLKILFQANSKSAARGFWIEQRCESHLHCADDKCRWISVSSSIFLLGAMTEIWSKDQIFHVFCFSRTQRWLTSCPFVVQVSERETISQSVDSPATDLAVSTSHNGPLTSGTSKPRVCLTMFIYWTVLVVAVHYVWGFKCMMIIFASSCCFSLNIRVMLLVININHFTWVGPPHW